ncbi:jg27310, partial [Pararge aegeria aegeria]
VNLRSIGRKRFAHLSESLDEIHVDANVPWGEDTLFTLEFRADEGGKYALHTCNNKYLSAGGKIELGSTSLSTGKSRKSRKSTKFNLLSEDLLDVFD